MKQLLAGCSLGTVSVASMPQGYSACCGSLPSRWPQVSTEAAVLHLRSLVTRLRLANLEFEQAEHKLDELCAELSQDAATATHDPCDAAILRSFPGVGTTALAILPRQAIRSHGGTTPPSEPSRVWRR